MKKYIIILVALLSATSAMAQEITPKQERDFYRKAYDLVRNYAKVSQISDDRTATQFYDLFESPHLRIANDLMSLSNKPDLSVSEYIDLLRKADMVTVGLSDVKKYGDIIEEDGLLKLELSFSKNISFVSPCNSFFDSRDFFGKDYNMGMTIVYDPSTDECRISELKFYEPKLKFPKDYRVLVKYDSRDNNLDINGKYVNFLMDQKVLRPTDQLYYRGAKVQEKDIEGQCDHKVYAQYNDKSWRVRLNGGFSVTGASYKLDLKDGVKPDKKADSDVSVGLDFGYVFPTTSHLRFGVFAGISYSFNTLELSMTAKGKDFRLSCDDIQDVDGNPYERIYTGKDKDLEITQTLSCPDFSVPLYLDMEYEFNSIFSAYVDAGLKFTFTKSTSKLESSDLKISGKYNEYKDPAGESLIIDKDINNFGEHKENYLKLPDKIASPKNPINFILGVGARINLTKSIAVDAGVQYHRAFSDLISDSNSYLFSYILNKNEGLNGGQDYVNLIKSLKREALKVNISLIYKF